MEVGRTAQIRESGQTGRKNGQTAQPSRALTVTGDFSGDSGARARSGGRPDRRMSAFLAHLALQYDGIAARRRARAERLEMAIASYGAGVRGQGTRPLHSDFNLKV